MTTGRKMIAELEPSVLLLERGMTRIVHDVGEIIKVPVAQARRRVKVVVKDAETGELLSAVVHLQGMRYPANEPFDHSFRSEFNAKAGHWSRELLWVEFPGYENVEVDYGVEVG